MSRNDSKKVSKGFTSNQRNKDSLLNKDLDFDVATYNVPVEDETEIFKLIQTRFRGKSFDNYQFEEVKEKIEEEIYDVKLCDGNNEILKLWEDIETEINKISFL